MRKNLYLGLIACAALTMTGCSNDEVSYDSSKQEAQPIQFGTYVGRDVQGRATCITSTTELKDNGGFGVFAYYNGTNNHAEENKPNFMYNQNVTSTDGNSWTYAPVKYWPNNTDDKVSFFAYAPYSTGSTNNISLDAVSSMTTPQINFTVNNTVQSQTDLLYADQTTHTYDLTKQNINGKITFKFQHALARIGFTVRAVTDEVSAGSKALDENTKIYVKKVMLMKNSTEDYDGITDEDENVFYTGGVLNLKSSLAVTAAKWTSNTGAQALTIATGTSTNGDFENCTSSSITEATTGNTKSTWGFELNSTNSTDNNQLNNDDSYMMIIPQDFTSGDTSTGFRIYVEYDVVTQLSTNTDNAILTENKITTKDVKINFQSGKAYTINLQLGMTSVKVGAGVEEWTSDSNAMTNENTNNPANTGA